MMVGSGYNRTEKTNGFRYHSRSLADRSVYCTDQTTSAFRSLLISQSWRTVLRTEAHNFCDLRRQTSASAQFPKVSVERGPAELPMRFGNASVAGRFGGKMFNGVLQVGDNAFFINRCNGRLFGRRLHANGFFQRKMDIAELLNQMKIVQARRKRASPMILVLLASVNPPTPGARLMTAFA
jgi:hypothetical protein